LSLCHSSTQNPKKNYARKTLSTVEEESEDGMEFKKIKTSIHT